VTKTVIIKNIFCPTGKGGGIDPTCTKADLERLKGGTYIGPEGTAQIGKTPNPFGDKKATEAAVANRDKVLDSIEREVIDIIDDIEWEAGDVFYREFEWEIRDAFESIQEQAREAGEDIDGDYAWEEAVYQVKKRLKEDLQTAMESKSVRSVVKSRVVSQIAEDLDDDLLPEAYKSTLPEHLEDKVNSLVRAWAETAGGGRDTSTAVQYIAKETFELKDASTDHYITDLNGALETASRDLNITPSESKQFIEAYLDAVYEGTQYYLRSIGLKPDDEIILYRGMTMRKEDYERLSLGGEANIKDVFVRLQPLSSFSLSKETAVWFAVNNQMNKVDQAPVVVAAKVKVKDILSTALSGPGCLNEKEVIVLGGLKEARIVAGELGKYPTLKFERAVYWDLPGGER